MVSKKYKGLFFPITFLNEQSQLRGSFLVVTSAFGTDGTSVASSHNKGLLFNLCK